MTHCTVDRLACRSFSMVGMATLKAVKSLAIVMTARPMATRAKTVRRVSQAWSGTLDRAPPPLMELFLGHSHLNVSAAPTGAATAQTARTTQDSAEMEPPLPSEAWRADERAAAGNSLAKLARPLGSLDSGTIMPPSSRRMR